MRFLKITDPNGEAFSAAWIIYNDSFPSSERRDYLSQRQLLRDPRYSFSAITYKNSICGIFGHWSLERALFIEHFAVDTELRGVGIGTRALRSFLDNGGAGRRIVLEVEPAEAGTEAARRIEFYRRLGFQINPFPYLQPSYAPGNRAIKMSLMSFPTAIQRVEFPALRSQIYAVVYEERICMLELSARETPLARLAA